MVSIADDVSRMNDAIQHAIKKRCLSMQSFAGHCQTETEKSPHICGLISTFMLYAASLCWTSNHSHSIVPGGFDV